MLAKSLLLIASAAVALASPCAKSTPTLPYNGGGTELPSPPSGVTLKHIALGFGIQNYTCASSSATPASNGALAMLYDITRLYPDSLRRTALSSSAWTSLTASALDDCTVPLNLESSSGGASLTDPFTADAPLRVDGHELPFLGHHYFDAGSVPTFDLTAVGQLLRAAKLESISAPASADAGPDGTGAVAWLQLGDAGDSVGLKYVYRVLTAGGNSHGCSALSYGGSDSTSYAAQYWFFG